MTKRALFRFMAVRPTSRRSDTNHLITGPFGKDPGTEFQQSVASADSGDDARTMAESFMATDAYIGDKLDSLPVLKLGVPQLSTAIEFARAGNGKALTALLDDLLRIR